MGRNRKKINQQLPKYVYLSKGRYVYKPYLGNGQFGKEIVLAKGDVPLSKVHREYEKIIGVSNYTVRWLINEYLGSQEFQEKAAYTQRDYRKYSCALINTKLINGKLFGNCDLNQITPKVIRRYLDSQDAKISANRRVSFLKLAFNWARQQYDHITENPCQGVKLNKETSRTRYIEDWEFELVKKLGTLPYIPIFMEIAYICRARWAEVADFKKNSITVQGLHVKRTKGSRDEITLWTPRLKEAVNEAKAYNRTKVSPFLIHDKDGRPIRYEAFKTAWHRLMKKALENGLKEKFTFHDVKAKGVSDHKHKHSGHKSATMRAVYDRKLDEIEGTR